MTSEPEAEDIHARFARLTVRHAFVAKKSAARKRSLRNLNKHLQFMQMQQDRMWRETRDLRAKVDEYHRGALRDRVSWFERCWGCRFREWYRWRNGETYPGRPGWRFLRKLPNWN